MQEFINLSPLIQGLIGTLFTWFVTALGAALVFFFKTFNKKVLNAMLGFAGGIMIAASFWSLLNPAIQLAEELNTNSWLIAALGFLTGGVFLFLTDFFLPHPEIEDRESIIKNKRSLLLVIAITLHNIPEGLAIGVAFGAAALSIPGSSLTAAIILAIGIGLQNFPEGAAVSIPLRREGMSRKKAFFYGQASGIVEPIAGVLGAALVLYIRNILPFCLAFAAGAMIYVVVEELIPESQSHRSAKFSTLMTLLGFTLMMILDVALG